MNSLLASTAHYMATAHLSTHLMDLHHVRKARKSRRQAQEEVLHPLPLTHTVSKIGQELKAQCKCHLATAETGPERARGERQDDDHDPDRRRDEDGPGRRGRHLDGLGEADRAGGGGGAREGARDAGPLSRCRRADETDQGDERGRRR